MKNRPWTMATSVMKTRAAFTLNGPMARREVIAGDCSVSRAQLPVERLDVVHESIDAVAGEDQSPASMARRSPANWIGEERSHGACESSSVAKRRDLPDGIAAWRAHDVAD